MNWSSRKINFDTLRMLGQYGIYLLAFMTASGLFIVSATVEATQNSRKNLTEAIEKSTRDLINHLYTSVDSIRYENPLVGPLESKVAIDQSTSAEKMELMHRFFSNWSSLEGELTVSELNLAVVWARYHFVDYSDFWMHRYDSVEDVQNSLGPHIDNELCLHQLELLNQRLDRLRVDKFNSNDLNLHRLLDTFGRFAPGVTSTNVFWPGMYENCIKHKIDSSGGSQQTRYCLAHLRHRDWPRNTPLDSSLAFKAGVCLPKACDPLKYKNKFRLIKRLFDFNNRRLDKDQLALEGLYCLPDEDSPMRMWWRAPETVTVAALLVAWILIVIAATLNYEYLRSDPELSKRLDEHQYSYAPKKPTSPGSKSDSLYELSKKLAFTNNLKLLFMVSRRTSEKLQSTPVPLKIDLRPIDALKTILMLTTVSFHTYMITNKLKGNGRDIFPSETVYLFSMNGFFTISGILLAYRKFAQTNWIALVSNPLKWLAFGWRRYVRLAPIYLIIMCYAKYLAKYMGSGPFWDYGTSSTSERRYCEQDSWFWSLTLTGNFKSTLENCIIPSWYLANDFQFYLISPIFLAAIQASPALGRLLLVLGMFSSVAAYTVAIFSSGEPDLRPIAEFLPHSIRVGDSFTWFSYMRPYCRIAPYLCGLLLGHALHNFSQRSLKFRAHQVGVRPDKPTWPRWFLKCGFLISFLTVCLYSYALVSRLNAVFARVLVPLSSTLHLMCGFTAGFYILLAATGGGIKWLNDFLSAPIWSSLVRLNLCILLTNYATLNQVFQTFKQTVHTDLLTDLAYKLLAIITCYLTAIILYVFIGAPIEHGTNWLLSETRIVVRQARESTKKPPMSSAGRECTRL